MSIERSQTEQTSLLPLTKINREKNKRRDLFQMGWETKDSEIGRGEEKGMEKKRTERKKRK